MHTAGAAGKGSRIGRQNRLLLGVPLDSLSERVPLQELLLVVGLHHATSRRVRELETEQGGFTIRVQSTGDITAYVLEYPRPDIPAAGYYWPKRSIRGLKAGQITPMIGSWCCSPRDSVTSSRWRISPTCCRRRNQPVGEGHARRSSPSHDGSGSSARAAGRYSAERTGPARDWPAPATRWGRSAGSRSTGA